MSGLQIDIMVICNGSKKGRKSEVIFFNIFGGIVRCDLIAEGIIDAVREVKMRIPVIVRLEGTNVEKGRMLLASSGLDIIAADNLTDAACKAITSVDRANP